MPVSVVILAAGQGKRMHSDLPKVLQPLAGRPLLAHVLAAARALDPAAIHVVYGHGGDEVKAAFEGQSDLRWALQSQQLGTGHAVLQALPSIPDDHQVLVLLGDVPLVSARTVQRLVNDSADGDLALLTAVVDNPAGYGRVIRDERGEVERIVEDKDATDDERRVNEINTGLMAFAAGPLRRFLAKLDNDNAQGEYYLTDVIARAVESGTRVQGTVIESPTEVLGINDRAQLAIAERMLQRRIAQDLMSRGVTFADPERVDVRGALTVGRDVFVDVGAVFEGDVELGDRVRIGPYAVIANSKLGAGHGRAFAFGDRRLGRGCRLRDRSVRSLEARRRARERRQGRQLRRGEEEHHRRGQQGQSPHLRRRRGDRPRRERRRGHDHLQLRRREQAQDDDWRSRVHRLGHDARRAGHGGRGLDDRSGIDDHERRAAGRAHARALETDHRYGLAAPEEETEVVALAHAASTPLTRGTEATRICAE